MKCTEKIHAEGLLLIFWGGDDPCGECPQSKMIKFFGEQFDNYACDICWDFILKDGEDRWETCPCYNHNEDKALRRTMLALEAKGYI